MIMKRSQRHISKSRVPNIDPYGTSSKISALKLHFKLTLVLCLQFRK